jgi:hypothetical protein
MFGTDRVIKSFDLEIYPITDPAKRESCSASGYLAQTTEIDFRNETFDDAIYFSLLVTPETFARYGAKIAHGLVDHMIFSVGLVDGFYSGWSPSISTSSVKVLTAGKEQNVTMPPSIKFEPPRLGHVGDAKLYIDRRLEFSKREPKAGIVEEVADFGTERAVPVTRTPAALDPQILQMLGSLKRAAWFVVGLLALIFIVTLLKH